VHVIPHGAFPAAPVTRPLPPELAAVDVPVVLFFGLLRPYKGLDLLLEAWRGIADAELWIVGRPRIPLAPLRAAAPPGVRFVPRFVAEDELPAFFARADLVVLPYTEIDQSGVLFTALGHGRPLLLSAVGGFPEIAGAALVPPGDAQALAAKLTELLADPARLAAPAAPVSWDAIARRTLDLYAALQAAPRL
jgi:glycosyltransferase involved in cell wall biosynthesis